MQIRLLYFATFRDKVGVKEERITLLEGATVDDLKARLIEIHPSIEAGLNTSVVAINREFAFPEDVLHESDEVAIFPPVSGGTDTPPTIVRITENVLDMNAVLESILLPTTGATCVLTDLAKGRVSPEQFDGTANLPSDAHPPVVEESLKQVVEEMRTKWPSLEGIALIQRTGQIEPGTPTVLVACSAAFRDESVFEAARYGIDRLRDIAPT